MILHEAVAAGDILLIALPSMTQEDTSRKE